MSYDPYEEAQERYAADFDRKRDEAKSPEGPHPRPYAPETEREVPDEEYFRSDRREHHPGRRADPESISRRIPNYESEPDYEAMTERRQERRRPDWDDPRRF
jgi:hypothetical protein